MVVTTKKVLAVTAGLALALNFSACKKDKESETDKLVGEWSLVQVNGQDLDPDYEMTFRFDADNDVRWCYEESGSKYCYTGEWAWKNDDEDEIEMEILDDGTIYPIDIEIDKLDGDVLEGDMEIDGEVYDVEFERIN